ncbi:MAG: SCO family protein [Phycisphaerales bacterium JB063]
MTKHLLNLPVVLAAVFSLAACGVISAVVFMPGPTKLLPGEPIPAPDFTVTDHAGQTLTHDDLLGEVWVCDFFLTRCTGVCPLLGQSMSNLAQQLNNTRALREVQLISFSVDPEHDRPDVLAEYRDNWRPTWSRGSDARWEAIDTHWRHATAQSQQDFWHVVTDGFKLTVGPNADPDDTSTPISHSSKLVLVDRAGNIRGYYDGLIPSDMEALVADLKRVVAE